MALRKEPARRYGSAAQLAGDLESHLQSLPVVARPDTLPYRARKFVRRHRAGVAAAAVVVLLVAGFIGSLIVQGRRIARERDKARYALGFLVDTFKEADPYHTQGERLTADEILTRGAERVSRDLSGQPDVQAALMDAIGEVERGLGRYDRAEPLLERGLALRSATFGPASPEAAESLEHLGRLKQDRSAYAEAEELLRRALEIKRSRLGDRRLETAKTLNQLGELLVAKGRPTEAEKLHREALVHRHAGGGSGRADRGREPALSRQGEEGAGQLRRRREDRPPGAGRRAQDAGPPGPGALSLSDQHRRGPDRRPANSRRRRACCELPWGRSGGFSARSTPTWP